MEEELRQQAEKIVAAKLAFYQCALIFSSTAVVLLLLSFYLPGASFWLRLPIPLLFMVLGVLYLSAYGFPTSDRNSNNWKEDEIGQEMDKLRRRKIGSLPSLDELSETDRLELKELDRLRNKWEAGEDYV